MTPYVKSLPASARHRLAARLRGEGHTLQAVGIDLDVSETTVQVWEALHHATEAHPFLSAGEPPGYVAARLGTDEKTLLKHLRIAERRKANRIPKKSERRTHQEVLDAIRPDGPTRPERPQTDDERFLATCAAMNLKDYWYDREWRCRMTCTPSSELEPRSVRIMRRRAASQPSEPGQNPKGLRTMKELRG